MLSTISQQQLQSQEQGWPASMPNMFSFEPKQPTVSKNLTKDEIKQALANVADKKAWINELLNAWYSLEWYGDPITYNTQENTLQEQQTRESWIWLPQLKDVIGETAADVTAWVALSPVKALSNLAVFLTDIPQIPFSDNVSVKWLFTGENRSAVWDFFRKQADTTNLAREFYWASTDTWAYTAWDVTWQIAQAVLLPWSILGKGGSLLWWTKTVSSLSTAWKAATYAWEWVLQTAKSNILWSGNITWWDNTSLLTWAWLWLAIPGAWALVGKAKNVFNRPIVTENVDEIVKAVEWSSVKAKIWNQIVDIPKPTISEKAGNIYTNITNAKPEVLAWRALTPSYAGKTLAQKVNTIKNTEANVKEFYKLVRTGKIKWDISSLQSSASVVVNALDDAGKKIWQFVDNIPAKITISDDIIRDMESAIAKPSAKRTPTTWSIQNFLEDFKGKEMSLQDAFSFKKVYGSEIKKLIKSWDTGTDQYSSLLRWVEKLTEDIDNVIFATKWAKEYEEAKRVYKILKSMWTDLVNSAQVEARKSPMWLVEQLGTLEALSNPTWFLKQQFAKQISEMNQRGGTWKRLINYYDQEAIKNYEKAVNVPKNISKPKVPKETTEMKQNKVKKAKKAKNIQNPVTE